MPSDALQLFLAVLADDAPEQAAGIGAVSLSVPDLLSYLTGFQRREEVTNERAVATIQPAIRREPETDERWPTAYFVPSAEDINQSGALVRALGNGMPPTVTAEPIEYYQPPMAGVMDDTARTIVELVDTSLSFVRGVAGLMAEAGHLPPLEQLDSRLREQALRIRDLSIAFNRSVGNELPRPPVAVEVEEQPRLARSAWLPAGGRASRPPASADGLGL